MNLRGGNTIARANLGAAVTDIVQHVWEFVTSDLGRNLLASVGALLAIAYTIYRWRREVPSTSDAPLVSRVPREFSANELEFVEALSANYVNAVYEGSIPHPADLARDGTASRALIKIHREKLAANSSRIIIPLACHRMNPLRDHIEVMFKDIVPFLPAGSDIPWTYDAELVSYIYGNEPMPPDVPTSYKRSEWAKAGDALVVATLAGLHARFFDGTLNFDSDNHVNEAAAALAQDHDVRRAVVCVTLGVLSRGGGRVPIVVPKDHPVAAVIKELFSTQLLRLCSATL
jgi:hypothetical protein